MGMLQSRNGLIQGLLFHGRMKRLSRVGASQVRRAASEVLADSAVYSSVYKSMVIRYIDVRGVKEVDSYEAAVSNGDLAYVMEGDTPILTTLIDFFKWLYESGALEWLIGLLMAGMGHQVAMNGPEKASLFVETTGTDGKKPDVFCCDAVVEKMQAAIDGISCFYAPPMTFTMAVETDGEHGPGDQGSGEEPAPEADDLVAGVAEIMSMSDEEVAAKREAQTVTSSDIGSLDDVLEIKKEPKGNGGKK